MLRADQEAIVKLFDFGLKPAQIAEHLDLEVESVQLIVANCSKVVQEAKKSLDRRSREVFSEAQALASANTIFDMGQNEELDAGVRFKCNQLVLDEHMGRRNGGALKDILGGQVNITVINEHYRKAKDAYEKAIDI